MRIIIVFLCLALSGNAFSQDMTKFKLYHPEEDAKNAIAAAVKQAKQANKHVFIQVGGNWCIWCARFNDFVTTDLSIDSLIQKNYVVYHLNHSKENPNDAILKKYRFPQRFGFPVFLVLDGEGNLLHTQNSEYLEENKSYSKSKVTEFLRNWSRAAIDPSSYKEQ